MDKLKVHGIQKNLVSLLCGGGGGLPSGGATFGIYWRPQKIDVNLGGGYFREVVTIGTLR